MTRINQESVDMEIVRLLIHDSRTPLKEVARTLGMAPSTVGYRIRKLKESGVIKRFTVSVDWRKMGRSVEAAVLINCQPRNVSKVANALSVYHEVTEVHSMTGNYDMLAMIMTRDIDEFREFIEKRIGGIVEIESFRTCIVLEDFKEE